ncbi:MAG TPA: hypothetical protein PKY38_02215 [Opitutaceae bacterium]|nr:hypothetical protein [Opitutaceae bacterium]
MATFLKLLRWVVERAAVAVAIVVIALAAYGLWLFLRANVDFELQRNELLITLTGERAQIREALLDVGQRLQAKGEEIAAEEERIRRAEGVIERLKALESTWDRLVGNPEQQRANREQMQRMEQIKTEAKGRIETLQREQTRMTWERNGLEMTLGRLDVRLQEAEAQKSRFTEYVREAWRQTRGWIIAALAVYFLGPTVGRVLMYFVFAPMVALGRPVRLAAGPPVVMPEVASSRVSLDLALPPQGRLWIKESFLQASDEGLKRRTRFLLDWRIPFTCLASGLVELIELRNGTEEEQRATLSNQANPHIELALVTLPAGAKMILRPSFIVGALAETGGRLVIRRRWQIWRWQSWITLQFRFFEFSGPCRLLVAGSRGVRAEVLSRRERPAARRTNQDATVGFSPHLDYRPARAETFWGYYRGMNPLFDDLFSGEGVFLCQEITAAEKGGARRFWAGLRDGVLRVFGL